MSASGGSKAIVAALGANLAIAGYHVLRRIPVVGSVVMQIAPSLAVVALNE